LSAKKFKTFSILQDERVIFIHVDLSKDGKANYLGYYHVNSDTDVPCNRMTKFDKYHSRFVPSAKTLTTKDFIRFTDDVMNDRVQVSSVQFCLMHLQFLL